MSFAAVLLVLLGVAFLLVRNRLNDGAVPRARSLLVAGAPRTVLAIWAHPDDEITSAGTLAAMARDGAQVILIYLTRGEAARDTGYGREDLARIRSLEAQAAGTKASPIAAAGLSRIPPITSCRCTQVCDGSPSTS